MPCGRKSDVLNWLRALRKEVWCTELTSWLAEGSLMYWIDFVPCGRKPDLLNWLRDLRKEVWCTEFYETCFRLFKITSLLSMSCSCYFAFCYWCCWRSCDQMAVLHCQRVPILVTNLQAPMKQRNQQSANYVFPTPPHTKRSIVPSVPKWNLETSWTFLRNVWR